MQGKTCLITGANSGIGKAAAIGLADIAAMNGHALLPRRFGSRKPYHAASAGRAKIVLRMRAALLQIRPAWPLAARDERCTSISDAPPEKFGDDPGSSLENRDLKKRAIPTVSQRLSRASTRTTRAKAAAKRTSDGDRVHSLRTLIDDLATITRNTVAPRLPGAEPFQVTIRPTSLQKKILDHLGGRL